MLDQDQTVMNRMKWAKSAYGSGGKKIGEYQDNDHTIKRIVDIWEAIQSGADKESLTSVVRRSCGAKAFDENEPNWEQLEVLGLHLLIPDLRAIFND